MKKQHVSVGILLIVVVAAAVALVVWPRLQKEEPQPNSKPSAKVRIVPEHGEALMEIEFDASSSSDVDGSISTYEWDFGDGAKEAGPKARHRYDAAGRYTVKLTVKDDAGAMATVSKDVVVRPSPPSDVSAQVTEKGIVLRWREVPGAISYNLHWSEGRKNPSQNGTRVENATSPFLHGDRPMLSTMSYVVTAVAGTGESEPSPVVWATVVPQLPQSAVVAPFSDSVAFLYQGEQAVQTGLEAGVLDERRVSVLRGRVFDRDAQPLSNVKVCLLNDGRFGETRTRADGQFDLAVNGGGRLTLCYEKEGYLPIQRKVEAPRRDFAWLPDVTLIPPDERVTTIDLKNEDSEIQVVRGSRVVDDDGERQATLLVPRGTTAEMVLPDGSTQPLEKLSVRVTEYTVGERGPSAMPARLPPTSAYTYCAEFSVDEAVEAGAKTVRFSQPVVQYVENFLGFPVGGGVPVGFYDADQAAWVPADDGRIVAILAVEEGLAVLDVDGGGEPADDEMLSGLGVTVAERRRLAALYKPGQSLWRVKIQHFSPHDLNWLIRWFKNLVSGALNVGSSQTSSSSNTCQGSVIEVQNQVLGELVPVEGTPFRLHYRSDLVPGRRAARKLDIQLSDKEPPEALKAIRLEVYVAGQRLLKQFPPDPEQHYQFTWDGKDGYGRTVRRASMAKVRIGYVYDGAYGAPPTDVRQSFAYFSGGTPIEGVRTREELVLWREWTGSLGGLDARALGLGGWTLNVQHAYDPVHGILYLGDRRERCAADVARVVTTFAGGGDSKEDGTPALEAELGFCGEVALAPDGSLYVASAGTFDCRVVRVSPDGVVTTVAGTGDRGYSGDGGPAIKAQLGEPVSVAVGPDGSVYIAEYENNRVRRISPIDPGGILTSLAVITTFAGTGTSGFSGDEGPATDAKLNSPVDLAFGPDGCLYVAENGNHRVRRIDPQGSITTVAGTGKPGTAGDGGPAGQAELNYPGGLAFGSDGSLYVAEYGPPRRVRRIDPSGTIETVAGAGGTSLGDGGPATAASLDLVEQRTAGGQRRGPVFPLGIDVGQDSAVYVIDANSRIRRIGSDGIITTFAGGGDQSDASKPRLASEAKLGSSFGWGGLAVGPDGEVYWPIGGRVLRIGSELGDVNADEIAVPSESGRAVYVFDAFGRHLRTVDALTGIDLLKFKYGETGLLTATQDADGNRTTIERGEDGSPLALVGPYGQHTTLEVNPDGYLAAVTSPAGETTAFSYGAGGLLASLTDHKANVTRFSYDDLGRLVKDEDAAGGFTALKRERTEKGFLVTKSTAAGPDFTYLTEPLPNGGERQVNACSCGGKTTALYGPDENDSINYPNGVSVSIERQPDPRFGMTAPLLRRGTIKTPGGLMASVTATRSATFVSPDDALSLATLTNTLSINGRTYTSSFDAAAKRISVSSPEGRRAGLLLDDNGRLRALTPDGLEVALRLERDERGRVKTLALGDQSLVLAYDDRGWLQTLTNAAGNTVEYLRSDAGDILETSLPSGRTHKFGYDRAGNVERITMPNGAVHKLSYSPVHLNIGYVSPDGDAYAATYDADRRLSRVTLPSNRTIAHSYDHDGRLAEQDYKEATVKLSHDQTTRRVLGITRSPKSGEDAQSIKFDYDGDLVTEIAYDGVADGRFHYTYDENFFVTGVTLDDRPQTQIKRDKDGLVTQRGPFAFDRSGPSGAPAKITDGKLTVDIEYDKLGRIAARTHTVAEKQVYRIALTYDNAGRIAQKRESVGENEHVYEYAYDADGQLTEVRRDGEVFERYVYDENGNRTSRQVGEEAPEAARYNRQDQLIARDDVAYEFDADGFLVRRGDDRFTYSARGELLKAELAGGETVRYAYDGIGRRIARIDDAGTLQYLYGNPTNPFQVSAVREPSGETSIYRYDTRGRLVTVERANNMYYVTTNQVGTPVAVTDTAGNVIARFAYDSYGVPIETEGEAPGLFLGFAGGLADRTTGLVRFSFRDYDPVAGRWTARDPIGFAGGQANLYGYVHNDPVNLRDMSGLKGCGEAWWKNPWAQVATGLSGLGLWRAGLAIAGPLSWAWTAHIAGVGVWGGVFAVGGLGPTVLLLGASFVAGMAIGAGIISVFEAVCGECIGYYGGVAYDLWYHNEPGTRFNRWGSATEDYYQPPLARATEPVLPPSPSPYERHPLIGQF